MRNIQDDVLSSKDIGEYAGPLFTIRWKWLLGTLVVMGMTAITGLGVYFYQTRDKSEFLIRIFREEEANGEWRKGISLLMQYHQENPNDMTIVRELAEAFERNGNRLSDWKNAANYYEILLAEKVSGSERLQLLEKVLESKRKVYGEDLLPTIQRILKLDPENALAWKSVVSVRLPMLETGLYQPGSGEPETFDHLVKKAFKLNPTDVYVVSIYCGLLREDKQNAKKCMSPEFRDTPLASREAEADILMEDLVRNNPGKPEALLTHYVYRLQNKQLDPKATEIDPELEKALELDPNNPIAMMYAGRFYEQLALRLKMGPDRDVPDNQVDQVEPVDSIEIVDPADQADQVESIGLVDPVEGSENFGDRWSQAINQYEKMIMTSPGNRMGYLQLAALYALDGEKNKQIEVLEKANKALRSNDSGILFALVSAYLENNDPKNATRVLGMVDDWIKRNRGGGVSAETIEDYLKMVTLYEGQSLAIAGQPKEALEKFRSILEASIPYRLDARLVFNSLMMYAGLLAETFHLDLSIEVYEKTLSYLDTEIHRNDPLNFFRMDRLYLATIHALRQLGQTGEFSTVLNDYIGYLRKELDSQPTNQLIRFSLASALFRQIMMQPVAKRDWTELNTQLAILQDNRFGIDPPWQVDLLQANVTWESQVRSGASPEEALFLLGIAEKQYKKDLLFLVFLEEIYHRFNSSKDSERVLELIRKFPKGVAFWYVINAARAEQLGNLSEAKKLIDEAVEQLPDLQKDVFQAVQERLGYSIEEGGRSLLRDRRNLKTLREMNAKAPTLQSLFQQGLLELDFGNTSDVAILVDKLRKLEDKDQTLSLFLDAERLLQEIADEKDSKIVMARSWLRTLAQRRPKWEYTHILEADIEDKLGNEEGVIVALAKVIDTGNTDPARHRDLIELYLKHGQRAEADKVYERSIAMFPNLLQSLYIRLDPPYQRFFTDFTRAIRREDSDTAGKIAKQWLDLAEKNQVEEHRRAEFHSIIGQGFYGNGELSIAEQHFRKAADVGGEAILPLARYLADTGKIQDALDRIYEQMENSETPGIFLLPVLALIRDHEYDHAGLMRFDNFVLGIEPESINDNKAFMLNQCIQYLMHRGKNDQALPFYRRLNKLVPDNTVVLNDLAYLVAFQQADNDAAREVNINEAIKLIDQALSLYPENPNLMVKYFMANTIDTKGLILLMQGNPSKASELFEDAVKIDSQAIQFRLHLAVALLRAENKDQAQKEFAEIKAKLEPNLKRQTKSNHDFILELLEAFPEEKFEDISEE